MMLDLEFGTIILFRGVPYIVDGLINNQYLRVTNLEVTRLFLIPIDEAYEIKVVGVTEEEAIPGLMKRIDALEKDPDYAVTELLLL